VTQEALITVHNLYKEFPVHGGFLEQLAFQDGRLTRTRESVKAISGVDLEVYKGESLCVVGESGCGKSTLARVIMGLIKPSRGEVAYQQQRIDNIKMGDLLPYRKKMQMIFQNPYASLNPRMTVQQTLEEPIRFHNPGISSAELNDIVVSVTQSVGVDPSWSDRYPHEFSGGQRQRIGIARALALRPKLIICDEPVSALDVSIQAQVLNILKDLQREFGLTYLFIAHNLSVVEHFCDRVGVMYLGRMVEVATRDDLFADPLHPYTQALMSAIPVPDPTASRQRILLEGDVPSPLNPPSGCRFHTRCPLAFDKCSQEEPKLKDYGVEHYAACWLLETGIAGASKISDEYRSTQVAKVAG
jgi:oligopeptide/dipeptide ABC transporter ATP-binding protein